MKITQEFSVAQPADRVWAFFQDVPAVARCLPGAEITEDKGAGVYAGRVTVKLGPFGAAFEGEAKITVDPDARTGHVEGKGVDRRGGSRSKMVLDYRMTESEAGTRVSVEADIVLSGPVAQFGRTGLIQETSNILLRDFVTRLEAHLANEAPEQAEAAPAGEIKGLSLAVAGVMAWLRSLLRRLMGRGGG